MYVGTHAFMLLFICTYLYICVYMYVHISICVCLYECICICIYVYIHVCALYARYDTHCISELRENTLSKYEGRTESHEQQLFVM